MDRHWSLSHHKPMLQLCLQLCTVHEDSNVLNASDWATSGLPRVRGGQVNSGQVKSSHAPGVSRGTYNPLHDLRHGMEILWTMEATGQRENTYKKQVSRPLPLSWNGNSNHWFAPLLRCPRLFICLLLLRVMIEIFFSNLARETTAVIPPWSRDSSVFPLGGCCSSPHRPSFFVVLLQRRIIK